MAKTPLMELVEADLNVAKKIFKLIEQIIEIDGIFEIAISFRLEGGDLITIGYGEQAEPAIVSVEHDED